MAAQYNEFVAPFQCKPSHFCTGKYTQGGSISSGQGIAEKKMTWLLLLHGGTWTIENRFLYTLLAHLHLRAIFGLREILEM